MKKPILVLSAAVLGGVLLGCKSDRTKDLELEGMFTEASAGILAIGSLELQAAPTNAESLTFKMWWDSPLLAPSNVKPCARLMLSGTNTCSQAADIVSSITSAIGINHYSPTNKPTASAPTASAPSSSSGEALQAAAE